MVAASVDNAEGKCGLTHGGLTSKQLVGRQATVRELLEEQLTLTRGDRARSIHRLGHPRR